MREIGIVWWKWRIVTTSESKMNVTVPKMNDGWGPNDGKVGYANNAFAGLLIIRLLESHILNQRRVIVVGLRDEVYNIRDSLAMKTKKSLHANRNYYANHWSAGVVKDFKRKLMTKTGSSTIEKWPRN